MAQETTNLGGIVDDPLKVVKETSEKAKYDTEGRTTTVAADATNGKAWATEYRKSDESGNNTVGVIRSFDGTEFEYDVAGLGEYAIQQNRAKAVEKAVKHHGDARPAVQHDFGNETSTHTN